jgi:hypothetical protein
VRGCAKSIAIAAAPWRRCVRRATTRAIRSSTPQSWKMSDYLMRNYPLLDVRVSTRTLDLFGATDELLDELAEVVRAGPGRLDQPRPGIACMD